MTYDYKRHGTTTLFAALNVATGRVIGVCMQRHWHQEWLAFLRLLDRETPAGNAIHVIADNYATHKHPRVQKWIGRRPRKSHELAIPENIRLHRLPGYSPELNPQEHVWDALREKEFPKCVFDSMDGVHPQLQFGLPRLAANTRAFRSLTAWPWIVSLNVNAH
jgi:transposase